MPDSRRSLALAATLMVAVIGAIIYRRKRRSEQIVRARNRQKNKSVNIGAIFGMDVGGTLTKIVYFEARKDRMASNQQSFAKLNEKVASTVRSSSSGTTGADDGSSDALKAAEAQWSGEGTKGLSGKVKSMYAVNNPSAIPEPPTGLPRRNSSESLAQLDSPDHQAALQKLYEYMQESIATGANRSIVQRDEHLCMLSDFLEGQLHFLHFETRNMVEAVGLVGAAAPIEHITSMGCTGGGAHKYANVFEEQLGITINRFDELQCLVRGMHFAITTFDNECFTFRPNIEEEDMHQESTVATETAHSPSGDAVGDGDVGLAIDEDEEEEGQSTKGGDTFDTQSPSPKREHTEAETPKGGARAKARPPSSAGAEGVRSRRWVRESKEYTRRVVISTDDPLALSAFPYLLVNIGSGVSILKITGPGQSQRVSGTSLGGGTYWGLCRLLTSCATYDDVLDIAENGDAGVVDMLVKDIYGGDYGGQLSGSMVASSFGKLVMKEEPRDGVREEDLALALLMMITNNIGQVAYLNAQLHSCSKIYFVGSFLRHNPISCRRLAFAIDFWSGGNTEALFLVHEGYFGALGTFLSSAFGDEVDVVLAHLGRRRGKGKGRGKGRGKSRGRSRGSSSRMSGKGRGSVVGSGGIADDEADGQTTDVSGGEEALQPAGLKFDEDDEDDEDQQDFTNPPVALSIDSGAGADSGNSLEDSEHRGRSSSLPFFGKRRSASVSVSSAGASTCVGAVRGTVRPSGSDNDIHREAASSGSSRSTTSNYVNNSGSSGGGGDSQQRKVRSSSADYETLRGNLTRARSISHDAAGDSICWNLPFSSNRGSSHSSSSGGASSGSSGSSENYGSSC